MPSKGDRNVFRLPEIKDEKKSRRHSIIGLGNFDFPLLSRRKRKHTDDDSLSMQSFDMEHKKKSRKSLLRVSSLANLLSPSKSFSMKHEDTKSTLQRSSSSSSFKVPSFPAPTRQSLTPYKAPRPSPAKRRLSHTWSEMMTTSGHVPTEMSNNDVKKQEAIYELYQGELDLVEDLNIVKKTYRDSMQKLQLLSEGELEQIFGPVDCLVPIHEELSMLLQNQRLPDGTTQGVGHVLLDWAPSLKLYVPFCSNQVFGKMLLDEKKCDPAVDDFLQRCQESPFSRKLDLWTLLDGARAKFIKYPLLMKSILKYLDPKSDDAHFLEKAIKTVESVIAEADTETGKAKCRYYKCRISFVYDEKCDALEIASTLVCNGTLKNNKNSKLYVFLFDTVLVVTRLCNHSGQQGYQVYRQPIPVEDLLVTDLEDGQAKMGSFRSAFSTGPIVKNMFKVAFKDNSQGQAHTLIATDEHDKRKWIQSIQKVIDSWKQETEMIKNESALQNGKENLNKYTCRSNSNSKLLKKRRNARNKRRSNGRKNRSTGSLKSTVQKDSSPRNMKGSKSATCISTDTCQSIERRSSRGSFNSILNETGLASGTGKCHQKRTESSQN